MASRCAAPSEQRIGDRRYRHGYRRTHTYRSWESAKARCYNPNNNRFHAYGARGITMCHEWRSDFGAFIRDMGERPPSCSLDRIDNNGPYSADNCQWSTRQQQQSNTSRNHRLTIGGDTLTLTEWGAGAGLPASVIRKRLNRGWSPKRAVQRAD